MPLTIVYLQRERRELRLDRGKLPLLALLSALQHLGPLSGNLQSTDNCQGTVYSN